MLSETELMDMENLPPEMSCRLDVPWHFVGETAGAHSCLSVICRRCLERNAPPVTAFIADLPVAIRYEVVQMAGHRCVATRYADHRSHQPPK